ncbi:hypothetical protein SCLCIDRAFT_482727 [Scleroderma citrinum Foug A]|uniref:Uncharacterized protein n=1 Tax=Scleroderma citrinum Foug A TaxID=1036808 RepID=A0A0C2ZJG7_9AGAM|nr:hypothetical protein SCLCIDRAFT_482727 [Scleroderma citrinum Foug A]
MPQATLNTDRTPNAHLKSCCQGVRPPKFTVVSPHTVISLTELRSASMEILPIGCVQYSRCNQWMLSRKLANYGHTTSCQTSGVSQYFLGDMP